MLGYNRFHIHPIDSANITGLRKTIDETFRTNFLEGASITSQNPRGGIYKAANMIDKQADTYYASKDNATTDEITFRMKSAKTFDCLMIREVIELGHRITEWSVDYSQDGKDRLSIPEATNKQSIGNKWIIRFEPLTAKYIRLRITKGKACPAIHTFGIYKQSERVTK